MVWSTGFDDDSVSQEGAASLSGRASKANVQSRQPITGCICPSFTHLYPLCKSSSRGREKQNVGSIPGCKYTPSSTALSVDWLPSRAAADSNEVTHSISPCKLIHSR